MFGMDVREAAGKPAGKGRVTIELARRLPALMPDTTWRFYGREPWPETPANVESVVHTGGRFGWHRWVAKDANRTCSAFFAPTSFLTPQWLKIPTTIFVHDLIAFLPYANPQRRARLIERITLGRAVKKARRIIVNSQATADDLAARYPAATQKTVVAPLAAGAQFRPDIPTSDHVVLRQKYDLPERFILTTGTVEPRKNLPTLLAAVRKLPEPTALVIAGRRGWDTAAFDHALAAARADGVEVHVLDYVPEDDLTTLYAAATVFTYPSLYEGFGLPVLEAMQSGTAVVCSDIPSLREIGGDAVITVEPNDEETLRDAVAEVLSNDSKRMELAKSGIERAKQFSWDTTAQIVAEALRA